MLFQRPYALPYSFKVPLRANSLFILKSYGITTHTEESIGILAAIEEYDRLNGQLLCNRYKQPMFISEPSPGVSFARDAVEKYFRWQLSSAHLLGKIMLQCELSSQKAIDRC